MLLDNINCDQWLMNSWWMVDEWLMNNWRMHKANTGYDVDSALKRVDSVIGTICDTRNISNKGISSLKPEEDPTTLSRVVIWGTSLAADVELEIDTNFASASYAHIALGYNFWSNSFDVVSVGNGEAVELSASGPSSLVRSIMVLSFVSVLVFVPVFVENREKQTPQHNPMPGKQSMHSKQQ